MVVDMTKDDENPLDLGNENQFGKTSEG
jgi:hypothetical protein